jgi:hypothetical protein
VLHLVALSTQVKIIVDVPDL